MPKILYKTSEQIEAEAKRSGKEYITYNYNFDDGRQRFITAEKREALAAIQQKLFNVDFDAFLDAIYAMELPQEIISLFENTYYNKPLYAIAVIASGDEIHLDKVLSDLRSVQENVEKQKSIAEELSAQLCFAAMKGLIRDYYSVIISRQKGYEGKPSRTLMGNYRTFYQFAAIYTGVDFSDGVYMSFLRLIENIKTDIKLIKSYDYEKITPEQLWEHTMHSCHIMIDYVNEFSHKVKK